MPGEKGLGMTVGKRGFSLKYGCEIIRGRMGEFREAVMEYGRSDLGENLQSRGKPL